MEETSFYKKSDAPKKIETTKELIDKCISPIIFPLEELRAASKTDMTYFKTDHHWTDFGAYIGYKELIKRINSDFKNYKIADIKNFNKYSSNMVRSCSWRGGFFEGETARSLGINHWPRETYLSTNYTFFDHPYIIDINSRYMDKVYSHLIKNNSKNRGGGMVDFFLLAPA